MNWNKHSDSGIQAFERRMMKNLKRWLSCLPQFCMLSHVNGYAAISRQQAHKLLKDLFAAIGEFGNVSTHTLRKTFAKAIYDATGGKIELVQIALGHAAITSTVSYLSFNTQSIDDAINRMRF